MAVPDLLGMLHQKPIITVVDVGAMSLGEGTDPYQTLIDAGIANIIGFEPVEAEYAKLMAMAKPGRTYLPYALGDGTEQPFHINNFAMTSSLLRPNHDLTDHFSGLSNVMQVVKTIVMKTHRLDDIAEVRKTDFLKLDIQGAELQVLQGGKHTLENVLMIQTEVEFLPLYQDQPLFAEVDQFMRSVGFLLHRFTPLSGCPFSPLQTRPGPGQPGFTQALWADAIYVRDFRRFNQLQPDKLIKLALLTHLICASYDLTHKCLATYDELMAGNLAQRYLSALVSPG